MFLSSILRKADLSVLCVLFEREDKMQKHKNKLLVTAAASLAFSALAGAASAETLIVASPQVPEGFDGDALKTHTLGVSL